MVGGSQVFILKILQVCRNNAALCSHCDNDLLSYIIILLRHKNVTTVLEYKEILRLVDLHV